MCLRKDLYMDVVVVALAGIIREVRYARAISNPYVYGKRRRNEGRKEKKRLYKWK